MRLVRRKTGGVGLAGFDTGPRPGDIWKETARHVVVKWPGHSYWAARGTQCYAPVRFTVYRKKGDWETDRWNTCVTVEEVIEFEPRRKT